MPTGIYIRTEKIKESLKKRKNCGFKKGHKGFRTIESYKKTNLFREKAIHWKGGKPKCIDCGKELTGYCSKRCPKCYHIAQRKPYLKFICQICNKEFEDKNFNKKRRFCSNKCYGEFLRKKSPWNKNRKQLKTTGIKNPMWKGDGVGYIAIHKWVRRHKGEPVKCEYCGTITKKLDWANKDNKYKRNLQDFIPLCRSCHRKYDIENNNYLKKEYKII